MTSWEEAVAAYGVRSGVELAPLTTYKLGGPARWYWEPPDGEALAGLAGAAARCGVEITALGRGSNIVASDAGVDGLVIRLGDGFRDLRAFRAQGLVRAGAAVFLPHLARFAAERGLGGLEFYVGIPGTVGGAVKMNAGFFGTETAEALISATVLDVGRGEATERPASELGLGYRTSSVAAGEVVLSADFRVGVGDPAASAARMREAVRWRKRHQPGGTLNAGSVFRNPPGDYAGRLIDRAGLKGLRRGGARVSEKHANFFTAERGARAQDVYDLAHAVRERVREETGVVLEPELRFVGRFDDPGRDGGEER